MVAGSESHSRKPTVDPVRRFAIGAALIIAVGVLIGWWAHIAWLKSVFPGLTTMKVNSAIGIGCSAISLMLLERTSARATAGARALAVLVLLIGAATLFEYGSGRALGLDELIFLDPSSTSKPFGGRASPVTAAAFVFVGLSLLLLSQRTTRWAAGAAHVLAVAPGAIGFLSIAGYAYGVSRLYKFGPYVSVALNTGVGLSLITAALILTRWREGWAASLENRPIARAALVQIGTMAVVAPFLTGLFVVWGFRAGYYEAQFAPALFAVAAAVCFLVLASRSAVILSRAEGEAQRSQAELSRRDIELGQNQARHLALVENLPQLVWTCLPDGNCNYLSRQWVEYTGMSEAGQLGLGWLSAVIHPEDADRTYEHWMGAVEGRHHYDIDFRIRRVDGVYRWFKARGSPIRRADGAIDYWFGTCTDIQDIVEARDVLTQSRLELEAEVSARTGELMRTEALLRQSKKMEAVGQLTGGLAHDFNNLLMGIIGALNRIETRVAQGRVGEIARYLEAASGAAERAAALTHRLLAFSRRQTLDPRTIKVGELIAGIIELIRRTIGPAVTLEIVEAPDAWTVLADAKQIENSLLNLCINARDAMPNGGHIAIETSNIVLDEEGGSELGLAAGDYLALRVRDDGSGMTPEVAERAFDPFFTTKPLGSGTGLGLSMVYGFARQSGQARIQSSPGEGTTVSIYLPRRQAAEEPLADAPSVGAASLDAHGETVLVVDDEKTVRFYITDVLEDEGYAALHAENGAAALEIMRSEAKVDLLITDVGLPGGLNGRQLADAARVARPELKILFITGYAESAVMGDGALGAGMAILTKPFSLEALKEKIAEVLRSTARQ